MTHVMPTLTFTGDWLAANMCCTLVQPSTRLHEDSDGVLVSAIYNPQGPCCCCFLQHSQPEFAWCMVHHSLEADPLGCHA